MKEVPLTQGKVALVDDEDYERLSQFSWIVSNGRPRRSFYENRKRHTVFMARAIRADAGQDQVVQYVNRNTLDLRKENLFVKGVDTCKTCRLCAVKKPVDAFAADKFVCKSCGSTKERHRRLIDGDRVREQERERYAKNPIPKREAAKRFNWAGKYPERHKVRGHRRRARIAAIIGGCLTGDEWLQIKAKYSFTCLRCGKAEPLVKLTIDHVIPLAKGGLLNEANIQPLCKSCNCSKGIKTTDYRTAYAA